MAQYLLHMNWESLLCMGDSITRGARTYLGYPEMTAHLLHRSTSVHWSAWNFAWNGYKAIDLLRAVDEQGADLVRFNASLCSIMIGTNDAKENTPPELYAIAVEQLVLKARLLAQNRHVMVLAIPALEVGMSLPYTNSMNDRIVDLNARLETIAADQECAFFRMQRGQDDFVDGVHLNVRGVLNFAKQLSERILRDRGLNG